MKYILYGGNLINLVFAEELCKKKMEFSWYTLGEKIGGHFSGINVNNNLVDLGMVFLEFGTDDIEPLDGARDISTSQALLNFFYEFKTEPAIIRCKVGSRIYPDYIISDDCSLLWEGNYKTNLLPEHPSSKWKNNYFESISYDEYCKLSYVNFYSEMVEPFAKKISFGGYKKLSARYHRSAWLPLYYQETISGKDRKIKPYPFRKFLGKSVADVISDKITFLKSKNNIFIDESTQNLENLILENRTSSNFISCDLGKFGIEYIDLLSENTFQTKINIAIFSHKENKSLGFDCINDIDDKEIYRVTFQTTSSGSRSFIVVEGVGSFPNDNDWASKAKLYLYNNFSLNDLDLEFNRSYLNGVRLPLPGAEEILNSIRKSINMRYKNHNCFNYGIQNGFQALSMNCQVSHAINNWVSYI